MSDVKTVIIFSALTSVRATIGALLLAPAVGIGLTAVAGALSACLTIPSTFAIEIIGNILMQFMPESQKQDITTFINADKDLFCTLSNLGSFLLATWITSALMGQAFLPLLACIAVGFACMFMGVIIASVLWGVYLGIVDASNNQAHLDNQARPGF